MKSATTQAKIGLSMKKLGMIDLSGAACVAGCARYCADRGIRIDPRLRLDLVAGARTSGTLDDDAVAGLEAVADQPVRRPAPRRCGPAASPTRPSSLTHEDLAAAAGVALDRLLRHRDGVGIDALLDQHADIHAGQQFALGIRELAAQRHLSGVGIDLGVGEQQLAGEPDRPCRRRARGGPWPRPGAIRSRSPLSNARRSLFISADRLGEVGIDRVELLDGGEAGGLVLHHQRAFADQRARRRRR